MAQRLKLRAADEEDLAIVSACMQDALIACNDLSFLAGEKRFVLVAQRFRWENCPEFMRPDLIGMLPCESYERVNSVLAFDDVTGVRLLDLKPPGDAQFLELLGIAVEPGEEGGDGPSVILFFAGGGAIRLEGDRILCHLEDLGGSWPTTRRPSHSLGEGV